MKQNKLSSPEVPSTRVERLPDMVASDLQHAIKWAKKNPLRATALGLVTIISLRNKAIRSVVSSAAVAFLSTKAANKIEHTLH